MSIIGSKQVICSVCSKQTEQTMIFSMSELSSRDLDTRPGLGKREHLDSFIQQCSHCGYCAQDLTHKADNELEIVLLPEYQLILKRTDFPKVSAKYLAASFIEETKANYSQAAWHAVAAAWASDDEKNEEAAKICRLKAIALIERATSREQVFSEELGANELIKADLLRKCGLFKMALNALLPVAELDVDTFIHKVAAFQFHLISQKDTKTYTFEDVNALVDD